MYKLGGLIGLILGGLVAAFLARWWGATYGLLWTWTSIGAVLGYALGMSLRVIWKSLVLRYYANRQWPTL